MGAGGGLIGMTTGSGIGAAVGVVPAVFTFGLSIPVCAFMGGACGLCAGVAVGGSAGLVGAGTLGYYGYERSDEIKGAAIGASYTAGTYISTLKGRALASRDFALNFVSGTSGTKETEQPRLNARAYTFVPGKDAHGKISAGTVAWVQ